MDFDTVMEKRRSIRMYKDEEVPGDLVEKVLEAGRLAPSAKNGQPWTFAVLSKERKDKVAAIMKGYFPEKGKEDFTPRYAATSKYTARTILHAPVLILVLRKYGQFGELLKYTDLLGIGAAIENMCLKAADLGLGSLWIRDTCYTEEIIMNYLGLQEYELVSALALGYAASEPSPVPRKTLEEITLRL